MESEYLKGYTQGVADGLSKVNVQYTYHVHEGNASTTANGCYITPIYHNHSSSCYVRCNGPMYVTKKVHKIPEVPGMLRYNVTGAVVVILGQ